MTAVSHRSVPSLSDTNQLIGGVDLCVCMYFVFLYNGKGRGMDLDGGPSTLRRPLGKSI